MAVDDGVAFRRRSRLSLRIDLGAIAVCAVLLLLAYAGWLPEAFATSQMQAYYWFFVGIGLVHRLFDYLDRRADRLGTERARKHATAAKVVFEAAHILVVVAFVCGILLLSGAIVREWHAGIMEQFPFGIISFLITMLVLIMIGPLSSWLERPAKHTEAVFAAIVLCMLLVTHGAFAVLALWQRVYEIRLPVWLTALFFTFAAGAAGFLIWCVVLAIRRLRTLRAKLQGGAAEQS